MAPTVVDAKDHGRGNGKHSGESRGRGQGRSAEVRGGHSRGGSKAIARGGHESRGRSSKVYAQREVRQGGGSRGYRSDGIRSRAYARDGARVERPRSYSTRDGGDYRQRRYRDGGYSDGRHRDGGYRDGGYRDRVAYRPAPVYETRHRTSYHRPRNYYYTSSFYRPRYHHHSSFSLGIFIATVPSYGYRYYDPYCEEYYSDLDYYYDHCHHHGHADAILVIDYRLGGPVALCTYDSGRWVVDDCHY